MIINIPTSKDFYLSGKEQLDFAWDTVAHLLTELNNAEYWGVDVEEVSDSYWEASKRRLTTALSIAQQGIEFILKGKIAQISPFLLIAESPSKWPSPYKNNTIDFSQFRTIDSQDLVKVHDTFSETKLSSQFVEQFTKLRKKRNTIMHSVDKNLTVHFTEIIETILFMHKALFPGESWATERLKFLETSPDAELGGNDYSINKICQEFSIVIDLLKPSQVREIFNINKRQRFYFCPQCLNDANTDADFDDRLAVLSPAGSKGNKLFCPICNKHYEILRKNCQEQECKGNVISKDGCCLSCGGW